MAKELKGSIINTKRAYEELEKEGFIKTVVGKGSYVSEANSERLREVAMSEIEKIRRGNFAKARITLKKV